MCTLVLVACKTMYTFTQFVIFFFKKDVCKLMQKQSLKKAKHDRFIPPGKYQLGTVANYQELGGGASLDSTQDHTQKQCKCVEFQ